MGFRHRYHIMMPRGDFFLPFQSTEKKGPFNFKPGEGKAGREAAIWQ